MFVETISIKEQPKINENIIICNRRQRDAHKTIFILSGKSNRIHNVWLQFLEDVHVSWGCTASATERTGSARATANHLFALAHSTLLCTQNALFKERMPNYLQHGLPEMIINKTNYYLM